MRRHYCCARYVFNEAIKRIVECKRFITLSMQPNPRSYSGRARGGHASGSGAKGSRGSDVGIKDAQTVSEVINPIVSRAQASNGNHSLTHVEQTGLPTKDRKNDAGDSSIGTGNEMPVPGPSRRKVSASWRQLAVGN